MSTDPDIEQAAAPEEEQEGPQFIEAFGKEAIISIGLFLAFVLFAIICLPTYIL